MATLTQNSYYKNLVNRAKQISSSNKIFYELKNIKQNLINNGFPNYLVDKQIKLMIDNKNKINDKIYVTQNNYNHINSLYCNQMHPNFRFDEKILKNIIHRLPSQLGLRIYRLHLCRRVRPPHTHTHSQVSWI